MSKAEIITRDLVAMSHSTENIYKTVNVIAKRARQVSVTTKEELNGKLAEFASSVDNLEEIFENREQIEISKHYEKMPKPSMVAINEFLEDEVAYRNRDEQV